jgi:hypothetical protein
MRPASKVLILAGLLISCASIAKSATISGTVKGPDGKAFKGAFVEAQNLDSRITVNVLSAADGRYRVENLPGGQYELKVRAVGYRFEPRRRTTSLFSMLLTCFTTEQTTFTD